MTDSFFAQPMPVLLLIVAIYSLAMQVVAFVFVTRGERMLRAAIAWWRRTFTDPASAVIQAEVIDRGRVPRTVVAARQRTSSSPNAGRRVH